MRRILPVLILLAVAVCLGWAVDTPAAHPAATAAAWAADPTAAAAAAGAQAKATAEAAAAPTLWTNILGWGAGALGLVIALGKVLPGPGGAVARVLGIAYDALVPGHVRDAETRQAALAQGMGVAVHLIQTMAPNDTIADLKAKLANRLPSGSADAVNALITELEAKGVQGLSIISATAEPLKPAQA